MGAGGGAAGRGDTGRERSNMIVHTRTYVHTATWSALHTDHLAKRDRFVHDAAANRIGRTI